ncbi:MAG: tRNA (adenine(22)-N(1))-methyltransferase TrmK [Bdellovibrionales bacterium]|nr:tRNA (adenine(22)-N(1))-methyltransferase TrmK [Bdellovibrionales bacterium]
MKENTKREPVERTEARQTALLSRMRDIGEDGEWVTHLGEQFIVFRNVLPPWDDSKPLIEQLEVPPQGKVLDVGTGTGIIAIFAAYKGAAQVVATDINPDALRNAQYNVLFHGFAATIEVRHSDVFSNLAADEQFDVITANLPFRKKDSIDYATAAMWDTGFATTRRFLTGAKAHLRPGGRIYMAQSSFGELEELHLIATNAGLTVRPVGERIMPHEPDRIYYAFELTPTANS